ncbi:CDP-diacylglycerol-glycerol-3-phosphate 3-phosphatidyltransferase protein [Sulfurovum sp. enrichment culture clone C5]|uniref:CDP-diacylglycerol-glycerol-3-phosphate 3-phosphatidyltransferase protein n=1 Tax=Sulfurovum sp. enrichment culture clone C5 TaxID=497650 RepID=A0A0S4XNP2_9BACT|nr:CDP-diacylglycerol-glycerol-3-phosphate 3-phosphatidyltransferase protein [Sulfurovum sp. enrichment culture clone C5]
MQESIENRRPIKSRSAKWAEFSAQKLVLWGITPNAVSMISIFFAVIGAGILMISKSPIALILVVVMIQARLICNLLDGMVAIEGGKKTPVGAMYNEIPDRFADSFLIIALGYAIGIEWLGWAGALMAMFTAYIRLLGGSLGLAQDFRGPMAKQHRMAVMSIACIAGAVEGLMFSTNYALVIAAWIIFLGSFITVFTRMSAIANALRVK